MPSLKSSGIVFGCSTSSLKKHNVLICDYTTGKRAKAPQTSETRNKVVLSVWWDWKSIVHYELLLPGKTLRFYDTNCYQIIFCKKKAKNLPCDCKIFLCSSNLNFLIRDLTISTAIEGVQSCIIITLIFSSWVIRMVDIP